MTGDVETDGGVLVIRRIHVTYRLKVDAALHDTVARVLAVHADACPVARSIGGSIDITTEVTYV